MKPNLITEELEWQIFDWLEGNLSAEESEILEKTIQNNPELQQHVNLLKATYLNSKFSSDSAFENTNISNTKNDTQEKLETSFKASLKKSDYPLSFFIAYKNNFWKVAASVSLLITAANFYFFNSHSNPTPNTAVTASLQTKHAKPIHKDSKNAIAGSVKSSFSSTQTVEGLTAPFTAKQASNHTSNPIPGNPVLPVASNKISHPTYVDAITNGEVPKINSQILAQSESLPTEEETVVMLSSPQKPKEIAQVAWTNVKEMMRQGKLPKIILKPQKANGNQQLIPNMNIGIQVNQMSFVRTVSYHPTQN